MPKTMRAGWLLAALFAAALVNAWAIAQEPANNGAQGGGPAASTGAAASAPAPAPSPPPPAAATATTNPNETFPFAKGSATAGATKAAVCTACHGPNGNSTNPEWPKLAGQSAVYIAEQLRLFRAGVRDNPVMKPLAANLSDQDISDLAVYYEAQTPVGLEADPSYWKAGQVLYMRGDKARDIPACVACHGPDGRGNLAAGYPALRAQQSVYVIKQLGDYASGARYKGAKDEATASRNGVMMLTVAKRLSQTEMRDVASFLQGLR
jgi:cytochrome c553